MKNVLCVLLETERETRIVSVSYWLFLSLVQQAQVLGGAQIGCFVGYVQPSPTLSSFLPLWL